MACIAKRRGRYVIDFYDHQGKRRWKTLPKGITKKKAKEALRTIEDQLARGIYIPDKKIPTFGEIVRDWLEYKRLNLRASTWVSYECCARKNLYELYPCKVNRITTAKIEKFLSKKQKDGINLRTLKKANTILGQVIAYAVRHDYINYNPARDAEKPKWSSDNAGPQVDKKFRVLNPSEIKAFLNVVEDLKYQVLLKLAVFSGARAGELYGLKWTDVDWFNNQIHIQRTFNKGNWYKPKTKSSNRKIDLGPAMMAELKKWKLACPPNKLNLMFPNRVGNPLAHENVVKRQFRPALKKAELPIIRFHNLRHTYASLLIEQGENIKYIQTQLGHSTPSITLDVYAHLMKAVNQEAACRLEKTIFEKNGSKMVATNKNDATV
jgi:integrase